MRLNLILLLLFSFIKVHIVYIGENIEMLPEGLFHGVQRVDSGKAIGSGCSN